MVWWKRNPLAAQSPQVGAKCQGYVPRYLSTLGTKLLRLGFIYQLPLGTLVSAPA